MHGVSAFICTVANHFSTWQISVPVDLTFWGTVFWGTVFLPGSVMWRMDGRSMKNKRGFIEPVHQTCIQDCTLFSCDLRTLGSGRHILFKCHYAYICLLKYSNLFQDSKCFNWSELWMLSWEADLSVMTPTLSPWSICLSLRVIIQEQKALDSRNMNMNDVKENLTPNVFRQHDPECNTNSKLK